MKKKKRKIINLVIIIAIIIIGGYFLYQYNPIPNIQQKLTVCTKEAKICPDGSTVGRVGPKCEFAPCPDYTKGWKIYKNSDYGFELKFPEDFFDINQQPKLLIGDCNYNVFPNKCPNINNIVAKDMASDGGDLAIAESNVSSPGFWDDPMGQKQTINNVQYCLHIAGDAATGHAFNYFYFTTVKNKKCLIIYLATSTENCDFYLPLEEGNTEQAKNYNNCLKTNESQPKLLDEIISTFKFTN